MPHELAIKFTSLTFDKAFGRFKQDDLGDFDLRSIEPDGNLKLCKHGQKDITGKATEDNEKPNAFRVEIDQTDPVEAHYRGIALRNAAGEVTSIVGSVKTPIRLREEDTLETLQQDETTWVATKP